MRLFVTGATGFVGGAVTRSLVKAGHEVRALVRSPQKAGSLREMGVELATGDVTERESLRESMRGVDGVFHVAGWYKVGVRDKSEAEKVNVLGTRNVLGVMRELQIPRGVYTSTLAIFSDTGGRMVDERYRYDGPHLSTYDRTKWEAHYQVAEGEMSKGLPLTIVMPGVVYGPGDRGPLWAVIQQYLRGKLRILPEKTAYCWGHVDDIASGHILAMEKGKAGETYIIAGPPHTLVEAFDIAERVTGIPAPRRHLSPGTMRLMSHLAATFGRLAFWSQRDLAETLRVGAGVTYLGSNERARRELGYQTRSLEDGFRETLKYEMEQLGLI